MDMMKRSNICNGAIIESKNHRSLIIDTEFQLCLKEFKATPHFVARDEGLGKWAHIEGAQCQFCGYSEGVLKDS